MIGTLRTGATLTFRQVTADYPALATAVAIVLVSLIPAQQYHASVYAGDLLVAAVTADAENAALAGQYAAARAGAEYALSLYERPWPGKDTPELRLDVARASLVVAAMSTLPEVRLSAIDEALGQYRDVWQTDPTAPLPLAGMMALRDSLSPQDETIRTRVENAAATYSAAALALKPDDAQLRADARQFYTRWITGEALFSDFDAFDAAYRAAVAALPDEITSTHLVRFNAPAASQTGAAPPASSFGLAALPWRISLPGSDEDVVTLTDLLVLPKFGSTPMLVRWRYAGTPVRRDGVHLVMPGTTAIAPDLSGNPSGAPAPLVLSLRRIVLQANADANPRSGKLSAAEQGYQEAATMAMATGDADLMSSVCWLASLDGFGKVVLDTCALPTLMVSNRRDYADGLAMAFLNSQNLPAARAQLVRTASAGVDLLTPNERTTIRQQLDRGVYAPMADMIDRLRTEVTTRDLTNPSARYVTTYVTLQQKTVRK